MYTFNIYKNVYKTFSRFFTYVKKMHISEAESYAERLHCTLELTLPASSIK